MTQPNSRYAGGLERIGWCKNRRGDYGEVAHAGRELGKAHTAGSIDSEACI
jgi:hypothetical protein